MEDGVRAASLGADVIVIGHPLISGPDPLGALKEFAEGPEHPQGPKTFNGKIHQCFGIQNISKVEGGKLKVVHKTKIEDGLYEPEGDYTTQAL